MTAEQLSWRLLRQLMTLGMSSGTGTLCRTLASKPGLLSGRPTLMWMPCSLMKLSREPLLVVVERMQLDVSPRSVKLLHHGMHAVVRQAVAIAKQHPCYMYHM